MRLYPSKRSLSRFFPSLIMKLTVAEKEQEVLLQEQEEKQKEHKDKLRKLAEERAA